MKVLLALLLLCSFTQVAFATNGDNMIGYGAISRAMGGTGIANPMGAESVLKNPALLSPEKKFELSFAGTYFSPDLKVKDNMVGANFTEKESAADTFMIPSIGLSSRITDELSFGLGAYGTSGLGADFRDTTTSDGLFRMSTSLSIMKFTPALAYQANNFSFGAGLSIVYGALSMAYDTNNGSGFQGAGSSDDLGLGANLGAAYQWNDFRVGVNYQSAVEMEYAHQLTDAAQDFQANSVITSNKLTQPAEYGFGVAYNYNKAFTATFDFKVVKWGSADGYKTFGWEDQNVYALGLAYAFDRLTLRAGFNYGKSPLGDAAIKNTVGGARQAINALNLVGFPAIVEQHMTVGAGYKFSDIFNLDCAYVYVPEKEETTPGLNMGSGAMPFTAKHSQNAFTLAGKWVF